MPPVRLLAAVSTCLAACLAGLVPVRAQSDPDGYRRMIANSRASLEKLAAAER